MQARSSGSVAESFSHWMPLLTNPSRLQSFPSSHVATAAGLAVVLIWCYPRGRWLFPLLCLLAACQRLVIGAHFLSDTFWGAALGVLVGTVCTDPQLLVRFFDRFENRELSPQAATGAGGSQSGPEPRRCTSGHADRTATHDHRAA